ncbi:hypothetical protein QI426_10500 [Staphylococcus aureus]|nr:hypothetical protein [Staphylococcus aureus]
MKTRCYDGKKWQYEFKYEGKRYRKKGLSFKTRIYSLPFLVINHVIL